VTTFVGYRDKQLDIACRFAVTTDRRSRCGPHGLLAISFTDDKCTTPIVRGDEACGGRVGFRREPDGLRIYKLGPLTKIPTVFVQRAAAGSATLTCVPEPEAAGAAFFSLGEEIPPETYVARATPQIEAPDRRISPTFSTTEDGARIEGPLVDTRLQAPCGVTVASDSVPRCLPLSTQEPRAFLFADEACTAPLAAVATGSQGPFILRVSATAMCPPRSIVLQSGPTHPGPVFRAGQAGACTPAARELGLAYFRVAPIDPSSFAPLELLPPKPGARLAQQTFRNADGLVETGLVQDTQHGDQPCVFDRASDGEWRCLPVRGGSPFGDAGCTQRLAPPAASFCGKPLPAQALVPSGPWCDRRLGVHATGEPVTLTGMGYRQAQNGMCVAVPLASPLPAVAVGAALDPGLFEVADESER
jgi:hypothetical protein